MGYAVFNNDAQSILKRVTRGGRPERTGRKGTQAEPKDPGQPYVRRLTSSSTRTVDVEQAHFGERLGTFTIIVLGEVISQIVIAASKDPDWDRPFKLAAVATFLLVFGLWWLTFQYSAYTEGPDKADALPDAHRPAAALPDHHVDHVHGRRPRRDGAGAA